MHGQVCTHRHMHTTVTMRRSEDSLLEFAVFFYRMVSCLQIQLGKLGSDLASPFCQLRKFLLVCCVSYTSLHSGVTKKSKGKKQKPRKLKPKLLGREQKEIWGFSSQSCHWLIDDHHQDFNFHMHSKLTATTACLKKEHYLLSFQMKGDIKSRAY